MGFVNDVGVGLAQKLGFHLPLALQVVQIFQEQHPGGLFGVVRFRGASRLFPQNIVHSLKSLLEHDASRLFAPFMAARAYPNGCRLLRVL